MCYRTFIRLAFILFVGLLVFSVVFAFAANNVVPPTRLSDQSSIVTANQLKPPACSAIQLTAVLVCPTAGGPCTGTNASELVIGSTVDDEIDAGKGDDCILGGKGSDTIKGEQHLDVCVGGPDTDSFHLSCEITVQ